MSSSENGIFVRMLTIFHIVFCLVVSIIGEAWTFSLQSLCFDLGLKEKEEKLNVEGAPLAFDESVSCRRILGPTGQLGTSGLGP